MLIKTRNSCETLDIYRISCIMSRHGRMLCLLNAQVNRIVDFYLYNLKLNSLNHDS